MSARRLCSPCQIVVLGEVAQPLLGLYSGLHLREQRRDGLKGVEFLGLPLPISDLDETEHARRHVAGHQWDGRHGGLRKAAPLLDSLLVILVVRTEHHWLLGVLCQGEDGIGILVVDDLQRIGIGDVGSWRPLGDQDRRSDGMVVVAKETRVDVEVLQKTAEDRLRHDRSCSPRWSP